MDRCGEYKPKGGDALRLGVKAGMWFMCRMGWQVELCCSLVTCGPHLSTSEIKGLYIKHYINSSVYFTCMSVYAVVLLSVTVFDRCLGA